jgi:AGZA family xanthine/uracil permease-like MFS transporter
VDLLHSYVWTVGDTVLQLGWGAGSQWALSYLLLAVLLTYVQFTSAKSKTTVDSDSEH